MAVVIDEVQAEVAPPDQASAQPAQAQGGDAKPLKPRELRPVLMHLAKREARICAD
jgi:hypothetical protein